MSNLLHVQTMIGVVLSALVLGGYAFLRFAWRDGFFSYTYFAYAPASGRGSAQGKCSRM